MEMQLYSGQGGNQGFRGGNQDNNEGEHLMFYQNNRRSNANINKSGHWTEKENSKYYAFVRKFEDKFSEKESRRQWKVFKALATFVKSRNANQCRSHHHKMTKNHESVADALKFMRERNAAIEEKAEKYMVQLEEIDFSTIQQGKFSEVLAKMNEKMSQKERQRPIPNLQLQNPVDQVPVQKGTDIANMRTEPTYGATEQNEYQVPYPLQTSPYEPFSSPPLMPNLNYCFPYEMPQPSPFQMPYSPLREQMWRECHDLFISWVNKMNMLVQM